MAFKTLSNSDNIPHTNLIQDSFKIEAKVMETSDSMAWECKLFTQEFIGYRATENMQIKLKIKTSYMAIKTPSKSANITDTNLIQDSFKIEAKVMETSDSMAWECKIFTLEFLGFRD